MLNQTCALCSENLTDLNKTGEHVIPHSIGGKLKVEGFICQSCNSRKGESWDAELAAQFNWLALMIGVKRDRKLPPELVQTASGEKYFLHPTGSMTPALFKYTEIQDGEKTKISFVGRTQKEVSRKVKEIVKRFPQLDSQDILSTAKVQTSYLDEPLQMTLEFGGPIAGRSIVKTALAFAFQSGINSESCKSALNFLRDEQAPPSCYGLSYLQDLIVNRPTNAAFHCVALHGSATEKTLYAYVEYFGLARWLIVLSNDYCGSEMHQSYAINPTSGETIDIRLDWKLSQSEIEKTINGYGYSVEVYKAEVDSAFDILYGLSSKRSFDNALEISLRTAADSLGINADEDVSAERWKEVIALGIQEFQPFLSRYFKSRRGGH